jgi:hypothetical protein
MNVSRRSFFGFGATAVGAAVGVALVAKQGQSAPVSSAVRFRTPTELIPRSAVTGAHTHTLTTAEMPSHTHSVWDGQKYVYPPAEWFR